MHRIRLNSTATTNPTHTRAIEKTPLRDGRHHDAESAGQAETGIGLAMVGPARPGSARPGFTVLGSAGPDRARPGSTRLGRAQPGSARLGQA
ncbi:hypothetical protein ACFPN7_30580 [Amycolatopsis halotolerans]|uniref:hypothetical protein n=1 Tax=Amycolatopsis halotolerans TaxID=330083 RepID=UPI00360AC925